MTGLKDFSTDAASNDVAAPPILWIEGQPASTVNNSARATMAALACWHADVCGQNGASGGASGTYVLGTSQGFADADYAKPFMLAFFPDATNPGPCKLGPDAASTKPLRRPRGVELAPGDVEVGTVYLVRWHPGVGAFTVISPGYAAPGAIQAFAAVGATPPGWVPCDGRTVSRTSYAALFAAMGTAWGAGDNATTFNVPDLRGRSLFGADGGTGRLTGAGGLGGGLGATGGSEQVALTVDQLANHGHGGSTGGAGGHDHGGSVPAAGQHAHGAATGAAGGHNHGASTATAGAHAHSGTTNTGGSHGHPITYSVGTAGSGATNRVVTDLAPNGNNNAGGATSLSGDHTHDFTTASAGDHSHGVTVASVGDHTHPIVADGSHTHPINGVGDHTHSVNVTATGSGAAHPNMPPGAVVAWAIKA